MPYQLTRSELTLIQIQLQEIVTHGKPLSILTNWGLCWITKEALGLMSFIPEDSKQREDRADKLWAVDDLVQQGTATWPEATGETNYPVPAPEHWGLSPQRAFEKAANHSEDGRLMWHGEYGASRLALTAHLLEYVTLKLKELPP